MPTVDLKLGGMLVPAADLRSLTAVNVMQRLSQPTLCELVFSDPPGPLTVAAEVKTGTPLEVHVSGQATELFRGEVTAREYQHAAGGERTVRLRAYDALHRLRLRHHVRTFAQMDAVDIARELLEPLGLEVEAFDSGPLREHVLQFQQSDLDLVCRLLAEAGLHLSVRGSRAQIFSSAGTGDAVSLTIDENLLDARVEVNSETACSAVDARGWHPLLVASLGVT
ncbi:MAG TPA: phage late control D family protein, partial [Trueperaceae bacterium]|nr:phage late control D family protein [Trueperaceae bacterium]